MKFFNINQSELDEWLKYKPDIIKEMNKSHPSNELYRLKTTGQLCTLRSYSENGTVIVDITGEFNIVPHITAVFNIKVDDLEPADIPDDEELVGVILPNEADANLYSEWMISKVSNDESCYFEDFIKTSPNLKEPNFDLSEFKDTPMWEQCKIANAN